MDTKKVSLKDLPYSPIHLQIVECVATTMEENSDSLARISLCSGIEGISISEIEVLEEVHLEADGFEVVCHITDMEDWLEKYQGPSPPKRVLH